MIARLVLIALTTSLGAAIGLCDSASRTDAPVESHTDGARASSYAAEEDEQRCAGVEPELVCSMAGQACPSAGLPRFSTQLDARGWTRLRALAKQGVVAVVLGDRVELVEGCRLPGRYHEAAAAERSPGQAWSSDRLVLLPDEPKSCGRATHFVASFAIRGKADGEAIALPLPCPPLGSGSPPTGCIGAGLDDPAREAAAKSLWEQAKPLLMDYGEADIFAGVPLALDIAALMPGAWSYVTLTNAIGFLHKQGHGGCLWLSEAAFAAHTLHPEFNPSVVDLSSGRVGLSHAYPQCETRPSLLTCFPERFVPGMGGNCW